MSARRRSPSPTDLPFLPAPDPQPAKRRHGGRASREKGSRVERLIVARLQEEAGLAAERIPLSGSAGGRFSGDVSVPLLGRDHRVEVKCRARGFQQLYAWLDGNDFLIIKQDHAEPLVVVPLRLAAEIARQAEKART